jgi:hypothetical protein
MSSLQLASMDRFKLRPGEYVSPDVGLSDMFTVKAVDDEGNDITFDFEPREWLAEWETLYRARLPSGASYSNILTVCGSLFSVRFLNRAEDERYWQFTVFDISTRTDRKLTLSDGEVSSLVEQIRQGLVR